MPRISSSIIILFFGLLLSSSFTSAETIDDNGVLSEYFEDPIIAESLVINHIFLLKPITQPLNASAGMIYFDKDTHRLKFYDGNEWQFISFYNESSTIANCEISWDCSSWGDCINNYQTRSCTPLDGSCSLTSVPEEKQACSVAEQITETVASEETANETTQSSENVAVAQTTLNETTPSLSETPTEDTATIDQNTPSTDGTALPSESSATIDTPLTQPETNVDVQSPIPEQLFDISFNLQDPTISPSDTLEVITSLENFGTEPVPARLIYTIYDLNNTIVYTEYEETRVYTDFALIKKLGGLKLIPGKYTLRLSVEYSGKTESFDQIFTVETSFQERIKNWFGFFFGGIKP